MATASMNLETETIDLIETRDDGTQFSRRVLTGVSVMLFAPDYFQYAIPCHVGYRLVDLVDDEEYGPFDTLAQARKEARTRCPEGYAIWHGDVRREVCDPYQGDDERVMEGLGMPTVGAAIEAFEREGR